jgi:hypothetical protein
MKSGVKTPALLFLAVGVVAFVVCLASFAERAVWVVPPASLSSDWNAARPGYPAPAAR